MNYDLGISILSDKNKQHYYDAAIMSADRQFGKLFRLHLFGQCYIDEAILYGVKWWRTDKTIHWIIFLNTFTTCESITGFCNILLFVQWKTGQGVSLPDGKWAPWWSAPLYGEVDNTIGVLFFSSENIFFLLLDRFYFFGTARSL